MAKYYGGLGLTFSASGDLNSKQFYFVQPATTARLIEAATGGSGPAPIGVLQNDPRDGEAGDVCVLGTSQVYASTACGAIGYRDWITSGSDGQAVLAAGAGSAHCGFALQALSSGSGVLIEAYIFPMQLGYSISDNTP